MGFSIKSSTIEDIKIVEYDKYSDHRGFFMETYRRDVFNNERLPRDFVQDNLSFSNKDVIRGLHFQYRPAMGKLVSVLSGKAFLVGVDIRLNSPTLKQWDGFEISGEEPKSIYLPGGFAFGVGALTDNVLIQHKCTEIFNPETTTGITYDDPDIDIQWPIQDPILSEKDQNAQSMQQWLDNSEAKYLNIGNLN